MTIDDLHIPQMLSFRADEAVSVFSPAALDEDWCRGWILRVIHQASGAKCPHCGMAVTGARAEAFFSGKRLVCKTCHVWFDARTGTVLAGSSLNYSKIFCLALLLGLGWPAKEIAARVGINQSTVYQWKDKLTFTTR